jgi:hypothetical protein
MKTALYSQPLAASLITFTPNASTGQTYALSELTAGEIVFRFAIIDLDPNA